MFDEKELKIIKMALEVQQGNLESKKIKYKTIMTKWEENRNKRIDEIKDTIESIIMKI